MVRRRDPLRIDLSADSAERPDDGTPAGAPGPGGAGGPDPEPGWVARRVTGPLAARWRGLSRGARLGVVGVAAVAVAGTVAGVAVLDARAEAAHAEHMVTMPGGVADLSEPLESTWRVETDTGVLAVLPGGVVVARDGTEVLAVDVATGREQWRRELGGLIDCGRESMLGLPTAPAEQLVCLHGTPERTVTVLDASGAVLGERDLGVANGQQGSWTEDAPQILPMSGGAVAVLENAMDGVLLDLDDPAADLEQARAQGRWQDPTVRVEDALTGEVRGEATLEFGTAEDLAACGASEGPDGNASKRVSPSLWVWSGEARLEVCARSVTVTPDGERRDTQRFTLADGGVVELVDDGMRLLDESGEVEVELPGVYRAPLVADSTGGPYLVPVEEGRLAAFDDAGERSWEIGTGEFPQVLARADGTAVLTSDRRTLRGVHLGTGDVRWTRDDLTSLDQGGVGAAATDGTVVLLTVRGGPQTDLVAIDVADGRPLWSTAHDARHGSVLIVDGRPVLVDAPGGGFTETVDGEQVESADAALIGLGG